MTPVPRIEGRIYVIRGHKVLLDGDLALLYGVPTKSLNLAVRRNPTRFPEVFPVSTYDRRRQFFEVAN